MDNDEQQAFLRAIADDPENDAPRLVYADWLDDNCNEGQPGWPQNEHGMSARAEFIRVQCELTALSPGDPRHEALIGRETELLHTHRDDWEREIREWFEDGVETLDFARGFAEKAALNAGGIYAFSDRGLPPQEPVLRSLSCDNPIEARRYLAIFDIELVDPETAQIMRRVLEGAQIRDEEVIALADSPHLATITSLSLKHNSFSYSVLELANSPYLANLRTLHLGNNFIGIDGGLALANSPYLANLQSLDLSDCRIGDETAIALATSPYLTNLQELHIGDNFIGEAGRVALANSPYLANLQSLNMEGQSPDPRPDPQEFPEFPGANPSEAEVSPAQETAPQRPGR